MLMERAGLNRLRPGDEFGDESAWSDVLLERAQGVRDRARSPALRPVVSRAPHVEAEARPCAGAGRGAGLAGRPQAAGLSLLGGVGRRCGRRRHAGRGTTGSRSCPGSAGPSSAATPLCRPTCSSGRWAWPMHGSATSALDGYAQPIVASDCPVPVDSHYERRAFGTLRTTLRILSRTFPDTGFELEKPLFEIETPGGPCLPDFLIRARRGGEETVFVIEVMGFERPEYLRGQGGDPSADGDAGHAVHDAGERVRSLTRRSEVGGTQGNAGDPAGARREQKRVVANGRR